MSAKRLGKYNHDAAKPGTRLLERAVLLNYVGGGIFDSLHSQSTRHALSLAFLCHLPLDISVVYPALQCSAGKFACPCAVPAHLQVGGWLLPPRSCVWQHALDPRELSLEAPRITSP